MDGGLLARRLRVAGFAVASIAPAAGGVVAQAGLVTLADGSRVFAKTLAGSLRWLSEPLVQAAFDAEDRYALERLCAALPELVPVQPPVLNHGDLWTGNIVATAAGEPVFIDPAVSYTWAESDLSMVWSANRPPVSDRFFAAYAELAPLRAGWRERMPVLHLRELLSTIAHGDDDWGRWPRSGP